MFSYMAQRSHQVRHYSLDRKIIKIASLVLSSLLSPPPTLSFLFFSSLSLPSPLFYFTPSCFPRSSSILFYLFLLLSHHILLCIILLPYSLFLGLSIVYQIVLWYADEIKQEQNNLLIVN